MMKPFATRAWLLAALLSVVGCDGASNAPAGAVADSAIDVTYVEWGTYVIHFNAFTTDQLAPDVASKYGIVRYWWVATKLVMNVGMSLLIAFSLRPGVVEAARIGARMMAGDPSAILPPDLMYPVVVAPTLLLSA